MTMNEYINSLKGKSIGVIGIGVSNTPLIRTLLDHGLTDITACDVHSAEDLGETARELKDRGVKLQLGPDYLEKLWKAAEEADADFAECDLWRYDNRSGKKIYRSCYGRMGQAYTLPEHMKYGPTATYKAISRKSLWEKYPCLFVIVRDF